MPWDILEGRSRDGKLRDGKFSSCKAIVISITGIQSRAVQRGSVYTLPTSYLHSSRNGTRRWHHGPQVWAIPQLLPFGSLHLGQKGYRAALPRAIPALLCMDCPPRDNWSPAMYRTPGTTWPQHPWLHCSRTLYLLLHLPGCNHSACTAKVQPLRTSLHTSCTQTDPMIFTFTLTDLSPASNNRPGGGFAH